MDRRQQMDPKLIKKISNEIATEFSMLRIHLGFTTPQFERLKNAYRNMGDQIFAMLNEWHDVVVRCEENPRHLLAAALQECENRYLAIMLVTPKELDGLKPKDREPREETKRQIEQINFSVPGDTAGAGSVYINGATGPVNVLILNPGATLINNADLSLGSEYSGVPRSSSADSLQSNKKPGQFKPSQEFHVADAAEPQSLVSLASPQAPVAREIVKSRFKDDFNEIKELGQGAFGVVFKARKKIDSKLYAVKQIKIIGKDAETTVMPEVLALAQLDHPRIVRYFHAWIEKDINGDRSTSDVERPIFLYIQIELCKDKNLKHWLDELDDTTETKKRPPHEKQRREITSALAYIHEMKYIHRDLKPANILFSALDNSVKVGDFGLAKIMVEDHEESSDVGGVAKSHTAGVGTLENMAPELRGKHYTNKVDIFALGVIVFEMFHIFASGSEREDMINDAKRREFPRRFQREHEQWCQAVRQMLSTDPDKRPTAQQLLDNSLLWKKLSTDPDERPTSPELPDDVLDLK